MVALYNTVRALECNSLSFSRTYGVTFSHESVHIKYSGRKQGNEEQGSNNWGFSATSRHLL